MNHMDPWSRDTLTETLRRSYGKGANDDLEEPLRFVFGVVDLARTRYHLFGETTGDRPTIFLLHPADPNSLPPGRIVVRRVPMLHEGREDIGGRVWFVNHVVNEGVFVELDDGEDIGSTFEWLRGIEGMGDIPAVVIDLRDHGLVANFYRKGLSNPTANERADLRKATLSLDEVREVLDGIHTTSLCTPDAQGHIGSTWKDSRSRLPVREAELAVQRTVKVGLQGKYLGVFNVVAEQPGPSGRFDLMVEQFDALDRTSLTRHVLLELKVLRSRTHTGTQVREAQNGKAIEDGVRQAAVYRDERNVRSAALCCYDMRDEFVGEEMFSDVRDAAAAARVELWSWHLFSSSKAYREAKFSCGYDPAAGAGQG